MCSAASARRIVASCSEVAELQVAHAELRRLIEQRQQITERGAQLEAELDETKTTLRTIRQQLDGLHTKRNTDRERHWRP
jgi:uncharacterized coiled-coil DUF342 family protein